MIEKIFIPTVHRVSQQITYERLPAELKRRVIMVVQAWERPQYTYDCEYLMLPDTEEYHFSHYYCLSKTRQKIYEAGQHMKYCVLDDDLIFGRRNLKYFGKASNMSKSKRQATEQDLLEMFETFDRWLDEPDVTVCGCAYVEFPPKYQYMNNTNIASAYWINGNDFSHILSELDLTSVRVMEDVCFLLSLLTRGYGNRLSHEFVLHNQSLVKKNLGSTIWDRQTLEQTYRDHQYLQKLFPGIFTILYEPSMTQRLSGGYRNQGQVSIQWQKAFNRASCATLESFIHD